MHFTHIANADNDFKTVGGTFGYVPVTTSAVFLGAGMTAATPSVALPAKRQRVVIYPQGGNIYWRSDGTAAVASNTGGILLFANTYYIVSYGDVPNFSMIAESGTTNVVFFVTAAM